MSQRSKIVSAIVAKDFKLFTRDRFFLYVSIIGLIFYAVLYWILPSEVDETLRVGVAGLPDQVDIGDVDIADAEEAGSEGIELVTYADDDALRAAVEEGEEVVIGMSLPSSLFDPTITVFVGSGVPPSVAGAVEGLAKELAYLFVGVPPPVSGFATEQLVLGTDRAGNQVSLQESFTPLLAFFVLIIESMALATLVASEVQAKTVKAVTITPARVSDFLTAKTIFGTLLAFGQGVILMLAIRSLGNGPVILLVAVFLGAVLVTGVGMLTGSLGKDYISVIFWGMFALVPMIIPAIAFMFPGSTAPWVKVLPTYPLARVLVDVTSYDAGWAEAGPFLGLLAVWGMAILLVGWKVLERRVQTV